MIWFKWPQQKGDTLEYQLHNHIYVHRVKSLNEGSMHAVSKVSGVWCVCCFRLSLRRLEFLPLVAFFYLNTSEAKVNVSFIFAQSHFTLGIRTVWFGSGKGNGFDQKVAFRRITCVQWVGLLLQ